MPRRAAVRAQAVVTAGLPHPGRRRRALVAAASRCSAMLALLVLLALAPPLRAEVAAPEASSGFAPTSAVLAAHDMVAAANPLAAAAGRDMLRQGGSAIDAAIATQLVLNLVEPQSSGIGGGAFLVYWSAKERRVLAFDGRETAPAAARPDRFLDAGGKPLAFFDAVVGGRSVGTPGVLRLLELAHRRYGRLSWATLAAPAIRLAEDGFAISPRLHALLAADRYLARAAPARDYFYAPDGTAKPVGTVVKNPELAATLRLIANDGVDAFYSGPLARDIVAAVRNAPVSPGDLATTDLADYQARERPPVCGSYRLYVICGIGPPSSGPIGVIEILGLLEPFDLPHRPRNSPEAWHLFAEASRLAYADRERWIADPDFVSVPARGLIDRAYLRARARLIDPRHAHAGPAAPGDPPRQQGARPGEGDAPELPSTSNIAIVDRDGNAAAMTTTIENEFGARLMVGGFLLNNELTDFSFLPERDGRPVANRVEGGKRPRSAMAPVLVFDGGGRLILVLGSAGGPAIITDVAKTLVGVLDWGYDLAAAMALPNIANRNGATEVEPGAPDLAAALAAMGHQVVLRQRASGLTGIRIVHDGLEGAADPRREGVALGD